VIGDFNGDGRPDLMIAGRTDRDAVALMILSNVGRGYRVIEAQTDPYDPDDPRSVRPPTLQYMYPGRYVVIDKRLRYPAEVLIEQPAVQVTGGNRQGAVLYVVERNTLRAYYLTNKTAAPGDSLRRGRTRGNAHGATRTTSTADSATPMRSE
jgi:hypothetical protein